MVDDKIVGRYWLIRDEDGLYLTQGDVPTHISPTLGWERNPKQKSDMGWLNLNRSDRASKDGEVILSEEFKGLKFPEIESNKPVEIEICKSGRVYWYES